MTASAKPNPGSPRNSGGREIVIRDAGFGARLTQACDNHPHCPPLHMGRLRWIHEEMLKRFQISASTETVRKWMLGEMKPWAHKAEKLAELLSVDASWLYLGEAPLLTGHERKVRDATVSGMVNVVAGFIEADGGHPAFPAADDKRAAKDNVDLVAIIKGANYSFHVSTATETGAGYVFPVPLNHENVIVLGVIRDGFSVRIIEIDREKIAASPRRSVTIEVTLSDPEVAAAEITDFASRL